MNEARIDGQVQPVVSCPKCRTKTMLCSGFCNHVSPDQEPYEDGKIEETEFAEDGIAVEIWLTCHYCPKCYHVFSINIESPVEGSQR